MATGRVRTSFASPARPRLFGLPKLTTYSCLLAAARRRRTGHQATSISTCRCTGVARSKGLSGHVLRIGNGGRAREGTRCVSFACPSTMQIILPTFRIIYPSPRKVAETVAAVVAPKTSATASFSFRFPLRAAPDSSLRPCTNRRE